MPVFDLFSQCARLVDNICELQKALVDDMFQRIDRDDESPRTVLETTTQCSRNLYDGITRNPAKVVEQQVGFWQDQLQLAHNALLRLAGEPVQPVVRPKVGDRRFIDEAWESNILFDYLKQSYLLTAEHALQAVASLDGIEPRHRERLTYYVRQLVHAVAPSNFALTNPEVLRMTMATRGENLVKGLHMMVEDKRRSADILNICMTPPGAFELGRDLACTPGQVVAESELFQLIQYTPTTAEVYRTPVLLVPSWVNKYYIYDLSPKNSMVKWLVEQGHTVFCMSWINPDGRHRDLRFEDYMLQGPLAAAAMVERITGEPQVNAVGYCLGGILLACAAAYCDGTGKSPFAAVTYLAASLDFRDPGEMGMFVDEAAVESLERQMAHGGYLDGRLLSAGFNLLKENDLYWNYYVQNYLKGERPAPFDLMHWNSDNTNVPAATHRFVMRELHLNNGLSKRDAVVLAGRPIDLARHVTPTYVLATDKDHIARWRSCYAATQMQGGEVRFVLAGSGHIAGVINPPQAHRYYFYRNPQNPPTPDEWLDSAFKVEGSWWLDWHAWSQRFAGERVPARVIDPAHCIEPAPGRYVRRRLDEVVLEDQAAPRAA